jgi:hypothetical protein
MVVSAAKRFHDWLWVKPGDAQIEQIFSALAGSGHAERRTHGVLAAT